MDVIDKNVDFSYLLNLIMDDFEYEDLVLMGAPKNLLDDPVYKQSDDILKQNFDNALKGGMVGSFWEQSKNNNTFRHIAVNRVFDGKNHLRLYLSPKDEYLYLIVNEMLKRSFRNNIPIYLKYSRENRYDKIVVFIHNKTDLALITKLLEEIKNDHPEWFDNMKKSPIWLSESKFKGAYITPEKCTKKDINNDFSSYTKAFETMMNNVRSEVLFCFRINDRKKLKNINRNELLKVFSYYFKREIGKMGLFFYYDENNNLVAYTNSLFPGFGKSVDEAIRLTDEGLEIGKRIDASNKRYYKIPFGNAIPNSSEEFKKFPFYDLDDVTYYNMLFYPHLYGNDSPGSR